MIAWPPPKENSDSGAKTRKMKMNRLSIGRLSLRCEILKAEAQWRKREDDGNHRPTQEADSDEDGPGDDPRNDLANVARKLHGQLKHHADADGDHAGHHVAHQSRRSKLRIQNAEDEDDDERRSDEPKHADDSAKPALELLADIKRHVDGIGAG